MNKAEALNCYQEAGKYYSTSPKTARFYFKEVIPYFRDHKLSKLYCDALLWLCATENRLGEFDNAEQTAEQTVSAAKEHLGKKSSQYISALLNLAAFYERKGKWEKGIAIIKESIDVNESLDEVNQQSLSRGYHQLGSYYLELGDTQEAIKFFEQAMQIWISQKRPSYAHINQTSLALAVAYRELDDWGKSKQYYLNSYSDSLSYLKAYYGLAAVYAEQEMVDSARYFVQKGRAITVRGKKPRFQEGEQLLGAISLVERDTLQALVHYSTSQQIRLKQKQPSSPLIPIVNTYRIMGTLLSQIGKEREGLEEIQRGISYLLNQEIDSIDWHFTPDTSDITQPREAIKILEAKASSLYSLYRTSKDLSHLEIAHASIKLGVELIPKTQHLYKSEGAKLTLSESARPLIELGIKVSKKLYDLYRDEAYLWDAFVFTEQIKSRFLIEELLETEAISLSNFPDETKQKLQALEADIGFYSKRIQSFSKKEAKDTTNLEKWKQKLFELHTQQSSLIQQLEETYPIFAKRNLKLPKAGPKLLQQFLDKDAHLLEFFWGKDSLYLFSIRRGKIHLLSYEITKELLDLTTNAANMLRSPDLSLSAYNLFESTALNLYNTLLSPALGTETPATLYLVLDGPLSFIPFEILLTQDTQMSRDSLQAFIPAQAYRKLPYLFKHTSIHYLHASSLIQWNSFVKNNRFGKLASFAPDYPGNLQLKHNKSSARKIRDILGGNTYLDQEASEANFKSLSNKYEALHLAVHGNSNVDIPINAYLDFGNSDSLGEDNRLYAYELYALALNAKLVSLIACEAGYGKLEKGEGVMSLARAFRMAGANSIMTSLWKADGRAASPIAEKFYEQLKEGKRPSEALQYSKKEFLQTASPDLTHPYFWATYVLTGKNEAIWPNYLKMYGGWISLAVFLLLAGLLYRRLNKKIKLS